MVKKLNKFIVAFIGCISLLLTGCSLSKIFKATLNYNQISMSVDSTKQLQVSSLTYGGEKVNVSNYTISWISSDTDIVSVSNTGLVKAINAGTANVKANIRVTNYQKIITASCKFIINDPNPPSITLNRNTANIEEGKTLQLSASIEHCADKTVVWSSDNLNVQVSNTGLVSINEDTPIGTKAVIKAALMADQSIYDTCNVEVIEKRPTSLDYTIMFYMCASTLEYDSSSRPSTVGLFAEDIKEILSVNFPSSVKVIIETGGTKQWSLSSTYIDGAKTISSKNLQRWEVSNHKLKLIETLNTNKMAEESSFASFLEWGLTDYDASQIGVVISGHGGAIAGCAFDDNDTYISQGYVYQNSLNCTEILGATKTALTKTGHSKLTWMGFDCCLMQTADYASTFGDYFDYMVGSQESEIGDGWDHDEYMQLLVNDPTTKPEVLLPKICETFVNTEHSNYCSALEPCLQTLSVLDLSKAKAFTDAFNEFVESTGTTSTAYNKYKAAFRNSYNSFGEGIFGCVDFKDFVSNISAQFSGISTEKVYNALNDLVISNYYCSRYKTNPCGLCAFFPEVVKNTDSLQAGKSDYTNSGEMLATKFSAYQEMCLKYGAWVF